MKPIAVSLCLALTLIQLSSCQRRASFDPAFEHSFFPLRPGLTWTYKVTDRVQNTIEILTDRTAGQIHVGPAKVGTSSIGADAGGGVVTENSGFDPTSAVSILYTVEDGYVTRSLSFGDRGLILFKERQFLPRHLKPDFTWSNSVFPFGDLVAEGFHLTQTHRTFLETAVLIVPAGHFPNCIRIETEAIYEDGFPDEHRTRRLRYLDWYAPNIGLIKTSLLENGLFGREIARVELVNFRDSQK